MVFVYPLGVPLYYALILFRNKEELATIRQLELSITNEVCAALSVTPLRECTALTSVPVPAYATLEPAGQPRQARFLPQG